MIGAWNEDAGGWGTASAESSPVRLGEARQGREHVWNDWDWDGRGTGTLFAGGVRVWSAEDGKRHAVRNAEMRLLHRLLAACEACVQAWGPLAEAAETDERKVRCIACIRLVDACAIELAQMVAADDEFADLSMPRERCRSHRHLRGDGAAWQRLVEEAEASVVRACLGYEAAELRTGSSEMRELTMRHRAHMESVLAVARGLHQAGLAGGVGEAGSVAVREPAALVV